MRSDRMVSEVLGEDQTMTPSDLYNAVIGTSLFGGYSKNQVDILLERAADVLENLINKNRRLKQLSEEQRAELLKYKDMEDSLRSALVSSQKMSENIVSSARFQAEALVEEARLAKAQAVFQMEQLPDALRAEIKRLMAERDRLRDDMTAILESHQQLLERIPRAEETGEDFIREEVKNHFILLHDEEESEDDLAPDSMSSASRVSPMQNEAVEPTSSTASVPISEEE